MAGRIAAGYPSSARSRMGKGRRGDLVTRPQARPHRRVGVGSEGNLTSGYEKTTHRRGRRQVLPARAQWLLHSCFLRVRGHPITHERSRAKVVGNLCPDTDRGSATDRAVADVVPRSCRQPVVRSTTSTPRRRRSCYPNRASRQPRQAPGRFHRARRGPIAGLRDAGSGCGRRHSYSSPSCCPRPKPTPNRPRSSTLPVTTGPKPPLRVSIRSAS